MCYGGPMALPLPMAEGFALAAAVAHDRGARRALPGLSRRAAETWGALPRALQQAGASERRARVAAIARRLAPSGPAADGRPHGDAQRAGFEAEAELSHALQALRRPGEPWDA